MPNLNLGSKFNAVVRFILKRNSFKKKEGEKKNSIRYEKDDDKIRGLFYETEE